MEYGIIVACLSLCGTFVLAVAEARMEPAANVAPATEREAAPELKEAA